FFFKKTRLCILFCLAITFQAAAVDTSHRAAIIQLLEITQTEQLLSQSEDAVHAQMKEMVEVGLRQSAGGEFEMTKEMRKEFDLFILDISDLIREMISYEAMKEPMVQIYAKAFSETEIYQIVEFYKTPVGQLTVERMPIIMQEVSKLTQQQMIDLMPKIDQMAMEFAERVAAQPNQ
ncbi:MAG: DUF2059 domain-containing protein, partial [Pseudomonadota bacterium]